MKQFIRYLYEYDNGNRVRNVGFIKVEQQKEKCTVHIHGKGLNFGDDRKLEVYIFYVQDGQCVGILQGMIESNSPLISYILKFGVEDAGDAGTFEAIDGIVLRNSDGRNYAAVWNEAPVDVERMRTREEIVRREENSRQEEMPQREEEFRQEEILHQKDAVIESVQEVCEETEEISLHKAEIEPGKSRETLIEYVEKLASEQETEEVDSYVPPRTRTYEKIQRRDISRFPRREWKLANNSFLLHGFYNYHHLLYIEEGDNSWIGVPGIYHEKERAAARAFGFPQFHRITDTDIELSNEEKNTYDDFGYWCRQVER